jgi:hypothetical protein
MKVVAASRRFDSLFCWFFIFLFFCFFVFFSFSLFLFPLALVRVARISWIIDIVYCYITTDWGYNG